MDNAKWVQMGVLDSWWKLKMGNLSAGALSWNLFDSAQEQSTAFVNWHSWVLVGRRGGKTQKPQNSVFLNSEHKERFLRLPVCFIQSVTLSFRARSEHSFRDVGPVS